MNSFSVKSLFLCFAIVGIVQSAPTTVDEVIGRYQEGTIEIEYTLDIYWFVRERTSSRKGTLLFNDENQFKVSLGRHQWVSDGSEVWQYSKRKSMATVYSLQRSPFESPKDLFAFLKAKAFVETSSGETGIVTALWESKESDRFAYKKATLVIDTKSSKVSQIILVDASSGDTYTYTLMATNFKAQVPNGSFSFVVPKGVEVVDKR